jgi:nucleoside-triphosphatase THEP1
MIYIVTGEKDAGKTTFAYHVALALKGHGRAIRGFLSMGKQGAGYHKRFELLDLEEMKSWPLAEDIVKPDCIVCGRYYFNTQTVKRGESIVRSAIEDKADLIVMDEIGKCELSGKIWDSAFRSAMEASVNLIVVISCKNLDRIITHYKMEEYRLFNHLFNSVAEVVDCIQLALGK